MFKGIKRIYYKPILNRRQKKVDELFEEEGFTEDVLEKQVEINIKRHELDIPDKSKLVNENFVQ